MNVSAGAVIDGRYRVIRRLGQGTFGEVYAVDDLHQDQRVALKMLTRVSASGGPWREAQILTQLRSPYVLEVWNADFDAGVPYLVTEVADLGDADSRLRPRGVPPAEAVRWLRCAARGAAATNDAGLLHRDIKPANMFLAANGDAKLGDFGIACLMDANGEGGRGGTLLTMAPEVVAGGNTSVASDVYSLGAALYALLAGQYAHDHPDAAVVQSRIISGATPSLRDDAPHVGRALASRVAAAMAVLPSDRYSGPAELDAALGDLPVPPRSWIRTDDHSSHIACWRGTAKGKPGATVCLVAAGSRAEVLAQHQPSARRILAACRPPAPPSAWSRNVRAAITAIG